jgi:hypothetical protein
MDETFWEKTLHALVFLGICGAIIFIGWNEPLRYRFMSPEAIAEEESPQTEVPSPWHLVDGQSGTSLDRAPYARDSLGNIKYRKNFDNRKVGIPTESGSRENTLVPQPR